MIFKRNRNNGLKVCGTGDGRGARLIGLNSASQSVLFFSYVTTISKSSSDSKRAFNKCS